MARSGWLYRVFFLLILSRTNAQSPVDSLQTELKKANSPELRVDLLNALAYELFDYDDSLAARYAEQALSEAISNSYPRGIKYAYTMVGIGYGSRADFPKALANYHKSLATEAKNSQDIDAYAFSMIGTTFRDLSKFDSADYYYERALRTSQAIGNSKMIAMVYKNMGYLKILQFRNIEAIDNLLEAENQLKNQKDEYLQAEIWAHLGKAYLNILSYDRAQDYYSRMCGLVEKSNDYFLQIKCFLNRSDYEFAIGNLGAALNYCFDALQLTYRYSYPPQEADLFLKLGQIYQHLSNYEMSLRFLTEGLRIAERHHFDQRTAQFYKEIAWVNWLMKEFDSAMRNTDNAQHIAESLQDEYGIAAAINLRGLIYLSQHKHDSALAELTRAKKMREHIGHLAGVSGSLYNISLVYEETGQPEKALSTQQEALAIDEKIGDRYSLAISYNSLAKLLIKLKKYNEVVTFLNKARTYAVVTNSKAVVKDNYELWAGFYNATGNYREAFGFQKKYQELNDSIFSESNRAKASEIQALYQLELKDNEIKLLNQQKQIQENRMALQQSQLNLQKIVITSGVLGFLLVSVLAWNIYKSKKNLQRAHQAITEQHEEIQAQAEELTEANEALTKLNRDLSEQQEEIQSQSEELIEANQTINEINKNLEETVNQRTRELKQAFTELDTFFYRSSHDFRRPLTTFLGLAEVAKITVKDKSALELFEKVRETAVSLDKMLVKLQSISDVGAQELFYKDVMLKEIFDSVSDAFRDELTRKEILIEGDVNLKAPFVSYPALVGVIIQNLVENSIQFSAPVNPRIRFKVTDSIEFITIEVEDNGHGIDPQLQPRIFDMYFRASHYSKGNGLGLYIVKKAVEQLKGEITLTSRVGVGTTFSVMLPRVVTS